MKIKISNWINSLSWIAILSISLICGLAFSKAVIFAIGILYLAYLNPIESTCFFAFVFSAVYMVRAIFKAQLVDNQTEI
jgi:hypothetical protein